MTLRPLARVCLVFFVVLITPVLALAEVTTAASANPQARPAVVVDERARDEGTATVQSTTPTAEAKTASARARAVHELVNRPPLHWPNPAWPRQWAFSVSLFVLVGLGVLAFAWRELGRFFRERSSDRFPAVALFAVALVLRLAIPPGPTNWHTFLYGLTDPDITARFGPGTWVVQAGLWSLFSPSDVALGRAYAFLGALSVPLLYAIVRAQKASIAVATSVAMFWALAPVHIRISASFSEHVVSSTLTLLLLLVALREGLFALALSALLFTAIGLCRFDAWPQLALVPLWVAFTHPGEGELDRSSRLWRALSFFALWAGSGIVIKALFMSDGPKHPLPPVQDVLGALFGLPLWFGSHLLKASTHPHWFSPVSAWLLIPGALWMFHKRRSLLLAILTALLVSFVPLGRTPGELVTSRYFLPAIALLLIPAGFALEWILERTKPRSRWAWRGVVYVATFAMALPALDYRYTFQDEYVFLKEELSRLSPSCAVASLPVRHPSMPRDIDCCMSPSLSSLDLAFPELTFIDLEDSDTRFAVDDECFVYYENPICHMDPGPEWRGLWDGTMSFFRKQCAEIRANNRLELLARAELSSELPDPRPLFVDKPAQAALYRVLPAAGETPPSSPARHSP